MADEDDHDDDHRDPVEHADELADALEDELADAVSRPKLTLPTALMAPALLLTAAIAAPLHPDGYSFAQILYVAFLRSPFEALITLLGLGSPFCFGAIVLALAGLGPRVLPQTGARALVVNLSFMHAQLLLVAGFLVSQGLGVMPLALLGFAVVSGGYFILHHARSAAGAEADAAVVGPPLRWLVRWGATVVVAICGWMRLQLIAGVRFGWAIELMLAACVVMTVLLMRRGER